MQTTYNYYEVKVNALATEHCMHHSDWHADPPLLGLCSSILLDLPYTCHLTITIDYSATPWTP